MAKVQLSQTQKQLRQFNIWTSGMLKVNGQTQADLARFLNLDQSGVSMKLRGKTPWSLREYFEVQQFFGEEFRQ